MDYWTGPVVATLLVLQVGDAIRKEGMPHIAEESPPSGLDYYGTVTLAGTPAASGANSHRTVLPGQTGA
jgi:hypothetical protein